MRFLLAVLLLSLLLAGCAAQADAPVPTAIPSPTPFRPGSANASDSLYAGAAPTPLSLPTLTPVLPSQTPVVILPESLPTDVNVPAFTLPIDLNPLTGLPPSDPALLERHPIAIKVANYPRYIRPQSGLTLADQVFEYYIEGGLTRFIAVFYGNDSEWVGPVRSGRFFDENIARMYRSYLVFKFADKRVLTYLESTDIAQFLVVPTNGSCPPFRLMPTRKIEVYNNAYFNTILWKDCLARQDLPNDRPPIRNGFFNEDLTQTPELDAAKIFTYYSADSYHYWEYVPDTGEYVRYQETSDTRDNKPEAYAQVFDNVTSQPVHAANVIVLEAYHTFANPFNQEDEVYSIDLTGSGEAYVFRDGKAFQARWVRTNKDQPLLFITLGGAPIYLKPGITFHEVIGTYSYVAQGDGEWYFHHATP